MYRIVVDQPQNVVHVVLMGVLSIEETRRYVEDLCAEMIRHGIGDQFGIIIDVDGCSIQTQEVILLMRELMASMRKARAIAISSSSALARLQIRRLFTQDYARIVATPAAARAWVIDGIDPDMPAGRVDMAAA